MGSAKINTDIPGCREIDDISAQMFCGGRWAYSALNADNNQVGSGIVEESTSIFTWNPNVETVRLAGDRGDTFFTAERVDAGGRRIGGTFTLLQDHQIEGPDGMPEMVARMNIDLFTRTGAAVDSGTFQVRVREIRGRERASTCPVASSSPAPCTGGSYYVSHTS